MDAHEDTLNDGYIQQIKESYLANPDSVSQEWQDYFGKNGNKPKEEPKTTSLEASPASAKAERPEEDGSFPKEAKLQGAQKVLANYMQASLSVPTATSGLEINVEKLWQKRKELNAKIAPQKLSFTHLIAWAIVKACEKYPNLNSTYEEQDNIPYHIQHQDLNLGIAVDAQRNDGTRGLIVPVIQGANNLSFSEFIDNYNALVEKARTNKLALKDLMGTTITLTNPGGIGTTFSVPRLMKGQAAIIALGSIHLPQGLPASIQTDHIMTMTNTYDHRVIQGAESGAFLKEVERLLQSEEFYADLSGASAPTEAPPKEAAPESPKEPKISQPEAQAPTNVSHEQQALIDLQSEADELEEGEAYEDVKAAQITASAEQLSSISKAMSLVKAHRTHGHLAARLDPLGSKPVGDPALTPEHVGLTKEVMETIPPSVLRVGVEGENFLEVLENMKEKYCSQIAYEFEHISDHDQRVWMRSMIESGHHFREPRPHEQIDLLTRLTRVEAFESFLKRKYLGSKQFSIEGVDMLVPMLDRALNHAAARGGKEVVLGMAHRGRLNVLAHIIGRHYEQIMLEFEAESRLVRSQILPKGGTGDVKYHHGAEGDYTTDNGDIKVSLSYNSSHLEYVTPIVIGKARAAQTKLSPTQLEHNPHLVLPIVIHGDAAFPGQGVVGETLNMQGLEGYTTGGTIHIIANNQIGFTTEPKEGRSTRYASDPAKGYDVPIIHVNADEPESCMAAMRLALAFRDKFGEDVVIDVVGYRRWGHNEGDEPAYTQPTMAKKIKEHPRVREILTQKLITQEMITDEKAKEIQNQILSDLAKINERVASYETVEDLGMQPDFVLDQDLNLTPDTTYDESRLSVLNDQLHILPEGFMPHPKLKGQLDKRAKSFSTGKINWAHAEALALATLVTEGCGVRLTGQDTERGTFSHRHLVLHDVETNETFTPIHHLTDAKTYLQVYNSPLSEAAAIGFEYGYSASKLDNLVIWEAQFGDFINAAQVYLDQFISAGVSKWGQTTRLTLLLPHGYEGNGPEHSSGRLERFLLAAAEGNMRVVNATTPAQYFHLLRRQAKIERARPLIVMAPKAILRHPLAVSDAKELSDGQFYRCLADPNKKGEDVTKLLICSGKIYYELIKEKAYQESPHIAIARIEMLAPFPKEQMNKLLSLYPNAKELIWTQEEPKNMGAYFYIERQMRELLGDKFAMQYVGRPERASVSEGYHAAHAVEQARIMREALS